MQRSASLATGVRLSYVEQGHPAGTPVVLLHGVTDSWHSFARVLPLLPPDIHACAMSQRGHGDSSRPASGYRLSDLAADLAAFLDVVQMPQAIIVGHSMGASVAQRFAIDHPDRTSGLVLMGAFATYREPDFEAFVRTSILPLTDPIGADFARDWQLSTLAREMDAAHLDSVVAETLKVPAFVWHAAFTGFLETGDCTSELRRVTAPTLLIRGERDTYASAAAQARLLQVIPHARLMTYERHGHAFHWEAPERFVNDLVPFLASPCASPLASASAAAAAR
jgi:pimeloyl-ACP methyl ester carboxylesterase